MNATGKIFGVSAILGICAAVSYAQPNPGGVASPSVWFQTAPASGNLNGSYHWADQSANESHLYRMGTTEEVIAPRSEIHTYNFNPAMPFDSTVSREFSVKGTELSQKTVVAVVGAKKTDAAKESFLYHVKGQPEQGRVLSKTKVIRTTADGKRVYDYSPDLLVANDTAQRVKILTYQEAQKSDHSIWRTGRSAKINLGGKFEQAWAAGDTAIDEEANSLPSRTFYMPEVAVYPRFLRTGERLRVESYLALKYGITLPLYIAPNGNLLWKDNTYKNRVAGYGRDDRSGFYQEKSTTAYEEDAYDVDDTYHQGNSEEQKSSAYNLLEVGFSENTSIPDSSYILFGDNGKSTLMELAVEEMSDTVDYTDSLKVMKRIWKLQPYGVDDSYTHRIELGYGMVEDEEIALHRDSNIYILIDRSGTDVFETKVDTICMTEVDEERKKIIFSDIQFDTTCYFTFAYAGVPMEESNPEKYEYILEVTDPTCDGYQANSDGYVKLTLPQNDEGFYCSFTQETYGGIDTVFVQDSFVVRNVAPLNYARYSLTVVPKNCNTVDFDGTGITLVDVNFACNGANCQGNFGSISWNLTDVQSESKVAFIDNGASNAQENVFRYGVRISDGKLNIISNGAILANALDVSKGDNIRIQMTAQDEVRIYKNGESIYVVNVGYGNTFKLGVKSTDGNVTGVMLEHFNWGRGEFPYFFFNPYSTSNLFYYSNGGDAYAHPTGFMRYLIDFNVNCSGSTRNASNASALRIWNSDDRSFTAIVTLPNSSSATFFVYTLNNTLIREESEKVKGGRASKSFSMNEPGSYLVVVVTDDGQVFDGITVIK